MKVSAAIAIAALCMPAVALAVVPHDGATIRTSGSTNTQAYDIKVWSDGSAASAVGSSPGVRFKLSPELASRFFKDVRAARANPGTPGRCMKSASFGTTTTVVWHEYTSVDLQCPPLTPEVAALNADVKQIQAMVNTSGALRRRIPLPREPRMAPNASPSPMQMNPTASPEVSPT